MNSGAELSLIKTGGNMKFSLLIIFILIGATGCQNTRSKGDKAINSLVSTASSSTAAANKLAKAKAMENSSEKTGLPKAFTKKSLYEELTGQKLAHEKAPTKILQLARQSKAEKNYALALKRYNTLIKRFPNAIEVQTAYYDKSLMYSEMGLVEQSKFNLKRAQDFKVKPVSFASKNAKAPVKSIAIGRGSRAPAALKAPAKVTLPVSSQLAAPIPLNKKTSQRGTNQQGSPAVR